MVPWVNDLCPLLERQRLIQGRVCASSAPQEMRATKTQRRYLETSISWQVLAPNTASLTMSADKSLDIGFDDNISYGAFYLLDIVKIWYCLVNDLYSSLSQFVLRDVLRECQWSLMSNAQPLVVLRTNDVPCLYQGNRPVAFPIHSSEHWKEHCLPGSHLEEHQCFGWDRGLCWQWPFEIHRLQQRDIQKEMNRWPRFQKHRVRYIKIPIGLYGHANICSKVCSLTWKWSNQLASGLCMTQSYRGISLRMKKFEGGPCCYLWI